MRYLPEPRCQNLPRWVHRDLPRAAPPDSRGSRRRRAGASYALPGQATPAPRLGAVNLKLGVQFLLSKRVRFRTSLDNLVRRKILGSHAAVLEARIHVPPAVSQQTS